MIYIVINDASNLSRLAVRFQCEYVWSLHIHAMPLMLHPVMPYFQASEYIVNIG